MTKNFVRVIDTSLRDGMHGVNHSFSPQDMAEIASALERAEVDTIEVGHGDGLAGSSINYGLASASDEKYLRAVKQKLAGTRLAVLLLPGIGTVEELKKASNLGIDVVRVATHVTEADVSEQHMKISKDLGLEVMGFLMMSHTRGPEVIIEEGKKMESYGADVVYVVDSAGALTPDAVRVRVEALLENLEVEVGFHAHNNLGLGVGNTLAAVEEGVRIVDGSLAGLGAGAGNAQTEILIIALEKMGYETGVDIFKIMDAAEDVVKPKLSRLPRVDRDAITLGYSGVYSSFLLHAKEAAHKFGIDSRDILVELGKREAVGGQEDWIYDVAYELAKKL